MSELDQRRLAGFAGFGITTALLVLTVLAYQGDHLASLGWQGGQYAWAFTLIAAGSIVLGIVLSGAPSPWRAVGTGMAVAGGAGAVLAVTVVVLFMVVLSSITF